MRLYSHKLTSKDTKSIADEILAILESYATNLDENVTIATPLEEVVKYAATLFPRTLIVQKHVQDPDYLSEHAAYYSKFTRKIKRYCTRIHMFSQPVTHDDVIPIVDELHDYNLQNENQNCYLGFITLRPIATCPIGATILQKPAFSNTNQYVITSDFFEVNLTGRTFQVEGTPFLQQDNAVGACAQAAIWMSLRTIRQKEGQSAHNPAEITDAATRYMIFDRTLPNKTGLSIYQMNEAIRNAGYVPHTMSYIGPVHDTQKELERIQNIKKVVYSYVESGIPVILILKSSDEDYHAVTAIGHGWEESDKPSPIIETGRFINDNNEIFIYDAASWIEPLIVHNDNTGPYRELHATPNVDYDLTQVQYIIPIIHETDFIDSIAARTQSIDLFKYIIELGDYQLQPTELVFRTYMRTRADFRRDIIDSTTSDELKSYYRTKWLPERVWVTEVNSMQDYKKAPNGGAKRLGLILLDITTEPAEYGASLHSVHFDKELIKGANHGVVVDQDIKKGVMEFDGIEIGNDLPLVRS